MELDRAPDRISETGLRQIHQLTDKYYRTGELSPSLVKALRKYYDNENTRAQLNDYLYYGGLKVNPFADPDSPDFYCTEHHRAPFNDGNRPALCELPEAIYDDPMAFEGTPLDDEGIKQLRRAKADPEAMIAIYRAVPRHAKAINPGDWITLSKKYADEHAEDHLDGESPRVLTLRVPAKHIFWDESDLNEFGYDPR